MQLHSRDWIARLVRLTGTVILFSTLFFGHADEMWKDADFVIKVQADGSLLFHDERTLVSTEADFGELFLCFGHSDVRIISATAVVPRSEDAIGFEQACVVGSGKEIVLRLPARTQEQRVLFQYEARPTVRLLGDQVELGWVLFENSPRFENLRIRVIVPKPTPAPSGAYLSIDDSGHRLIDLSTGEGVLNIETVGALDVGKLQIRLPANWFSPSP